jgi:3-hydroxyisobutyrate dehydrogenase-like beta-hydroxyacid dehydrogenase
MGRSGCPPLRKDDTVAQLTLLGTGFMGSAVGKALLSQGHDVHVWNRTPGKTRPLEKAGAVCHADVGAALDRGDGVILLLSDHASANQILENFADRLLGKDVLDLMTGGSQHASRLASLIQTAGGHYLDGVIANFPANLPQ